MKKLLCTLFVFLLAISAYCQPIGKIIDAVSQARYERGLGEIYLSEALCMAAEEYSTYLVGNPLSHEYRPVEDKLQSVIHWSEETGEREALIGYTIFEVLALRNYDPTPTQIAHAFDNSRIHAMYMYHKDAYYMGWSIVPYRTSVYIIGYIAVRSSNER